MKRRKLFIVLVIAAIAVAFGWARFATHNVPVGQAPLAHLDAAALETLKAEFNRAAGETRIIALLSPT
jgi:hypothetical protein